MNDNGHNDNAQADTFMKMWGQFASRMAQAGMAYSPTDPPPDAARAMRDAALKAMGEYCDQVMRSPEFVDTLKQSMSASIEMRKQLNEFLGRVHHEFQAPSRQDMDQIMLALRHLEHRIVDQLERLDERLDAIESRVNRNTSNTEPAAKTTSKKATASRKSSSSKAASSKAAAKKVGKRKAAKRK